MDADGLLAQLEEAYRQHLRRLYVIALAITGCPAQAEDAVHDAFARVARSKPADVGNLLGYLVSAVRNAAFDLQRRLPKVVEADFVSYLDPRAYEPGRGLQEQELRTAIARHMAALSTSEREVIAMKVHAEMTFQEIAAATGEPLQTVASRYRRALGRLREMLETQATQSAAKGDHAR